MVQCLHELSPCVSPVFICSSGDFVVHLLQDGQGGISRSDVVSCSDGLSLGSSSSASW